MFSGKLTKDKAENLAKKQFYAGFFFLPWLWMSNYFFFWDIMKVNPVVNFYCKWSLRCFIVACGLAALYWGFIRVVYPDSGIWIIKPDSDTFQDGIFTKVLTKDYFNK